MRTCLMVEGQEDVSWDQWLAVAAACEEGGFDALFRSDHYGSVAGVAGRGSLDAWATLSALAARTSRIRLGTLVSPATFRHPSVLAKSVATVDHISGGRVELGLGAGWLASEHAAYGFTFPPGPERFEVLSEQLEIVHRSWTEETFSLAGAHYLVQELQALPKPVQRPHPPLIVGGKGGGRLAALAARWADEFNTTFAPPEVCRRRRARVLAACEAAGRDPATLRFSVMLGCLVGEDAAAVSQRARRVMAWDGLIGDPDAWLASHAGTWIMGTAAQAVDQLAAFREAGMDGVMLQDLLPGDVDMVRYVGREIAPAVC